MLEVFEFTFSHHRGENEPLFLWNHVRALIDNQLEWSFAFWLSEWVPRECALPVILSYGLLMHLGRSQVPVWTELTCQTHLWGRTSSNHYRVPLIQLSYWSSINHLNYSCLAITIIISKPFYKSNLSSSRHTPIKSQSVATATGNGSCSRF
jgi:hypothetical protein